MDPQLIKAQFTISAGPACADPAQNLDPLAAVNTGAQLIGGSPTTDRRFPPAFK